MAAERDARHPDAAAFTAELRAAVERRSAPETDTRGADHRHDAEAKPPVPWRLVVACGIGVAAGIALSRLGWI